MGIERVLIVDWDIHAAQGNKLPYTYLAKYLCTIKGTQYCVNGDPGIKLISIHRYEHGQLFKYLQ